MDTRKISECINTLANDLLQKKIAEWMSELRKEHSEQELAAIDFGFDINVSLQTNRKCMARTGADQQCSRSRIEGGDFCHCHNEHLPYGRIDRPMMEKQKKKRDAKIRKADDLIDDGLYVRASLCGTEDGSFLIDDNGLVFRIGESSIIGYLEDDEIVWV